MPSFICHGCICWGSGTQDTVSANECTLLMPGVTAAFTKFFPSVEGEGTKLARPFEPTTVLWDSGNHKGLVLGIRSCFHEILPLSKGCGL